MERTSSKEKILVLRFKNKIHLNEVPLLRGAINELVQENNHILFHNHDGDNFRYSYPLIQYKRINQIAAIVCVNEGTEVVGMLMSHGNLNCRIGSKEVELEIDSVKANQFLIQSWNSSFTYSIRKWLALNQENYNAYLQLEGIGDKCLFLEKILVGNILSLGKGLNIFFENEIKCKILDIQESNLIKYKNVKMMAFDIEFKTNVSIPDFLGLGKGASLGFGMVTRKHEE